MNQHCPDHEQTMLTLNEIHKMVTDMNTALLGDMKDQGWLSRIRNLEQKVGFFVKGVSTVSGILFAQLIALLYGIFTHKITINW